MATAKIPSPNSKETVYVDIDDEITNLVDKVKGSPQKIVALVLPKRATVLQSIVNMKLLKRAAEQAHKNVVLITSEAALYPLAGAVGVHVAKTLQSKPSIPPPPDRPGSDEVSEMADEPDEASDEAGKTADDLDTSASVGALAAGAAAKANAGDADEAIELDNISTDDLPAAAAKSKKSKHSLRGGKIKVPNFERFRLGLMLGVVALILLIIGWYFAFISMPKAKVVIKTDSAAVQTNIQFTAAVATKDFNLDQRTVPATYKEIKKTDSEKATATGQKDNGTKTTGSMTITNCTDNSITVPAGTSFANSGFAFVTDVAVTVPPSDFFSNGNCKNNGSSDAAVTAGQAGDKYNLSSGRTYTTSLSDKLSGTGSAMSGGTSKIVTVISQSDVDGAKQRMKGRQDEPAKTDLRKLLGAEGLFSLSDTFAGGEPKVMANPAVGAEAAETTVTTDTTYGMLGVKQDYLSQMVKKVVDAQIDKSKQTILNDGVAAATFSIDERKTPDTVKMTMAALAEAGPQLDSKAIANDIRGKKKGDAEKIILARPGIKDVTITYSPFWVFSTPKAAKKINVSFEKPPVTQSQSSGQTNDNP